MAEIDPVILELRADLGKYRADLASTTSQVQRLLGNQEKSAQRLEAQMRKSSGAISASLRGLAGTLGTYFTGRELVGLIDGFTRLQNSLKVAGLEGAQLEQVQSQLLALSTKYGVSIEGLADLYGKTSQTAQELGASQQQLVQLTEASSQALKITGTSATAAQGALLGLTQALASGVVRAEEFNQINEGGLRPLLQVAANTERFGGSVAKLRIAVTAGKVSSQEFFQAILGGADQLDAKASKATLTLAGAFEALTSQLTVYIGQSAQASGTTAVLAGAIKLLADNLDTLIPALATIALGLGVGLVTNAVSARLALLAASGAAVTLAGTSAVAGRALLAAFGGTVGVAITALVIGIGYLVANTEEAARAAKEAELQAIRTASAQDTEKRATELLAAAKGAEKAAQIEATRASRDRAAQALQTAKALQAEAKAALVAARAQARKIYENSAGDTGFLATIGRGLGGAGGAGPTITPGTARANKIDLNVSAAQKKLDESERKIAALEGEVDGLSAAIGEGAKAPALAAAGTGGGGKKRGSGGGGPSGPTASEIEQRFNDELISIGQQTLSARQSLATSAKERADLERTGVELARRQAINSIDAEKNYTAAQKEVLKKQVDRLADFEIERVNRDERLQLFDEENSIAEAKNRAASDSLRDQFDLAKTDDERRRIALEILDAEDAYLRSKLEAVIANKDLTDAVRQQARIELDALNSSAPTRRAVVEKANQGALGRYIDDISDTKKRTEEAIVRELQSVNDGITDALTKQLGIKNQFVKDLFSIFLDQVIFQPLAEALRKGQSGGGGIFGSILSGIGSLFGGGPVSGGSGNIVAGESSKIDNIIYGKGGLFGRASGGYVAPGQTVRVNEQAGGAEYLRMGSQGGTVIPLGQVNQRVAQAGAQGGVVRVIIEEGPNFLSTIRTEATGVSLEVTRAAYPSMVEGAAQETQRRLSRPRMPGAGR